MKKILVTGGAGFIGSHLCDYLISKGFFIICVDNLLTGSKKNINGLISNKNFRFVKKDVTDYLDFDIDYIFHLASPASPIDYWNYPEETLLTNSQGTLNILKLAKKKGAKFLLASTSEIYGDPLEHPQKETYYGNVNSFGPRSCYDESKRFAEAATYVYLHKYDIDIRIVRIFNTYGPRMQKNDGRVVSNFINQALTSSPITVDGDGSQTRSFCYVSDLVAGIYKAMFVKGTKGEIFNLGNPDEITILDLANEIISLIGSDSKIVPSGSFRRDDPMKRKPDISKAKKILGWKPEVSIGRGLEKTIDYYRKL